MTNDAIDLKDCPFCGGEAEIEQYGTPRMSTIYACQDCGCRLETGEEWGHGRQWNTRAAPQITPEVRERMIDVIQDAIEKRRATGKDTLPVTLAVIAADAVLTILNSIIKGE